MREILIKQKPIVSTYTMFEINQFILSLETPIRDLVIIWKKYSDNFDNKLL